MPTIHTLALFSAAALAMLVIPGPVVIYVTGRSASQGARAGAVSVLGVHTGTLVHLLAAIVGLSALLTTSVMAFTVIRWVGAAYLVALGVRTILRRRDEPRPGEPGPDRPLHRLYLDGVVVNLFNPKTALFFLAFLPQFTDPDQGPVWTQTLVLGLLLITLGLLSDGTYALAGARVGRWLRSRPRGRRRGPVVEGGLLVGLGIATVALPGGRQD